jgi:hypothetical protein
VIDPLLSLTYSAGASQTDWRLEVVVMSRKNYKEVAEVLRYLKRTSPVPEGWDQIIEELSKVFKKDNPRFSYDRFRDYIER